MFDTYEHELAGYQEHAEHMFGAQYDDVRERYASEIKDMQINDMIEEDYHEYMQKVYDAGFGRDADEYEAYWKRTLDYYEQQGY
jgi:hypothetical protein